MGVGADQMNTDSDQSEDSQEAAECNVDEVATSDEEISGSEGVSEELDEIAELRALSEKNWDKYLRAAAELENVRKRAARDVENAHKFAVERFATELLAVCDSLEMALNADETGIGIEDLKAGNEATLKLFTSILQRFGVSEINPSGESFDPEMHEAMTVQHSDECKPGNILTVYQKGYALNGRLMRPARVVVAGDSANIVGKES